MNDMHPDSFDRLIGHDWLDQIFRAKAAMNGGVVRRALRDIQREIGLPLFELEVRRRGYHLVLCGGQAIIICNREQVRLVC